MKNRFSSSSAVNVNRNFRASMALFLAILTLAPGGATLAQHLTPAVSEPASRIVPFEELLKRPTGLRPELQGQHPRIFFTASSLQALRERAHGPEKEVWQAALKNLRALKLEPPKPGDPMLNRSGVEQEDGDLSQYDIAYILADATNAYAIERDPKYLEAAKKWLLTVIQYDPWGYTFRTPNVDLPPAHLLYAVGFAYDVLYNELTPEERGAVRTKLAKQARLMYDFFKYKPNKKYAYSQNHTFIPMAGLAVAAFALMGEESDAPQWAQLARAIYDRVLTTFDVDGYYYEGFHYWTFSFHWIIRYLDALEHATGEDLYPAMRAKFQPLKYYAAHSILPDGKNIFDFGDAAKGSADRNKANGERLNSGYEVLYRLAAKYRDGEAQGIADWLRNDLKTKTWEQGWALYSRDSTVKPVSISSIPTSYWFKDSDTVFWRSGWDKNATAFAFRCGPPEGHHVTELAPKLPEWRLNTGHAHPDANSFIIYANGKYLTGDTGYTGVKLTKNHNTILVDGKGQQNDGRHEVFKDVPYDRLDRIRIEAVWSTPEFFYGRGDAAAGYDPALNLELFKRHFLYVAPDYFLVWDELASQSAREFSWLLSSDRDINKVGPALHEIRNESAGLFLARLLPGTTIDSIEKQLVISQGRPGEVEKGNEEQRGLRLETRNEAPANEVEFLHFLQPVGTSSSRPVVKSLPSPARGALIDWPGGDKEIALIDGTAANLESSGGIAILRWSSNGSWRRLITVGDRLSYDGNQFFKSTATVAVAFNLSQAGVVDGTIKAEKNCEISIRLTSKPHSVRVNGRSVKFNLDSNTGIINFPVNAGANEIVIE